MQDVARSVARIQRAIAAACTRSGRSVDDVVLVGASKRQPLERLQAAFEAGVRVLGENRVQEAEEKIPRLPDAIDWHLIGPLQSNKARRAAEIFSTVHSIDRLKIARALARHATDLGKTLDAFVQFNLGGESTKSGFAPEQVAETLEIFELPGLRVRGLMAIPPPAETADEARVWFRQLRDLRAEVMERMADQEVGPHRVTLDLSMGMSSDFEVAIEEGATHVRVGSALFGERPG